MFTYVTVADVIFEQFPDLLVVLPSDRANLLTDIYLLL